MKLRKLLFWVHLSAGSIAGIVILIMSATGMLLAYQRQVTSWVDHRHWDIVVPQSQRLPVSTLLADVQKQISDAPSSFTLRADRAVPAEVTFGRDRLVFVDPYSGRVLGEGSQRVRTFFRNVEDWHRWLAVGPTHRDAGRAVTGICSLAFLILACTGLYIWCPRNISWQRFRNASTYRRQSTSRARDWNLHTVTGFLFIVPLVVLSFSATIMGNNWANNLLFRAFRSKPSPVSGLALPQSTGTAAPSDSAAIAQLDAFWARAEQQEPAWQSISLHLPVKTGAPLVFAFDSDSNRPDTHSQLTLNTRTGEIAKWQTFSSNSLGQRVRSWIRFTHTGEAGGWWGETIVALGCAAGMLLVCTGLMLAWRRLFVWSAGLRAAYGFGRQPAPVSEERIASD